jgi:hypothetical protein
MGDCKNIHKKNYTIYCDNCRKEIIGNFVGPYNDPNEICDWPKNKIEEKECLQFSKDQMTEIEIILEYINDEIFRINVLLENNNDNLFKENLLGKVQSLRALKYKIEHKELF